MLGSVSHEFSSKLVMVDARHAWDCNPPLAARASSTSCAVDVQDINQNFSPLPEFGAHFGIGLLGQEGRLVDALRRRDFVILEELRYLPVSRTGGNVLFHLLSYLYEYTPLIITANLPFREWGSVFGDQRMTTSMLDRLTHHCTIVEPGNESWRVRNRNEAQSNHQGQGRQRVDRVLSLNGSAAAQPRHCGSNAEAASRPVRALHQAPASGDRSPSAGRRPDRHWASGPRCPGIGPRRCPANPHGATRSHEARQHGSPRGRGHRWSCFLHSWH